MQLQMNPSAPITVSVLLYNLNMGGGQYCNLACAKGVLCTGSQSKRHGGGGRREEGGITVPVNKCQSAKRQYPSLSAGNSLPAHIAHKNSVSLVDGASV
jgi:hypothetical protein